MKLKPKSLGQVCADAYYGDYAMGITNPDWERAAKAVIREYEKRQRRPVRERPMVTGANYIVLHSNRMVTVCPYWSHGWPVGGITNWRPLPKGPKG